MHSPSKGSAKKTRKSTFNQATVLQSDVGEFQGGYFVMPDSVSTKENDYPLKSKTMNSSIQQQQQQAKHIISERSPSRRKQQYISNNTSDFVAPSSPMKERLKGGNNDLKKPHTVPIEFNSPSKKEDSSLSLDLHMPSYVNSSCPDSPSKQANSQYFASKDILSTSPSAFGRWAGPAFGNAPHPSTLPLPEFPMFSVTTPPHTPKATKAPSAHSVSSPIPMPGLSGSPYGNDKQFHGGNYQQPTPQSPPSFLSASPPFSAVPVVPFPYVTSHVPQSSSPLVADPSLAQLSTDLRRLLNINAAPVLVSASSS